MFDLSTVFRPFHQFHLFFKIRRTEARKRRNKVEIERSGANVKVEGNVQKYIENNAFKVDKKDAIEENGLERRNFVELVGAIRISAETVSEGKMDRKGKKIWGRSNRRNREM